MLKQRHKSKKEYAKVFETLTKRCELNESPIRLITRFMNGLNDEIAKCINHLNFLTLDQTIQATLRVEISFSLAEVIERTKMLMASIASNSLRNHKEQVSLVEDDNAEILEDNLKDDHVKQVGDTSDISVGKG